MLPLLLLKLYLTAQTALGWRNSKMYNFTLSSEGIILAQSVWKYEYNPSNPVAIIPGPMLTLNLSHLFSWEHLVYCTQ